ncbi:MAG: RsbRD N-terminal domain-containing protein [candidate division Zixibacteria bacterium]|nr:RsbRD N-terminal domain-containing protein [candidate division Zixibacteria bacterium]
MKFLTSDHPQNHIEEDRSEGRAEMKLVKLLEQRREAILNEWFDSVAESYPLDTSTYLKNQADQFQNPVGHTFKERLPVLLAELYSNGDQSLLAEAIDDLVKIRTVQASAPSQAVAFVFLLKNIVRRQLKSELTDSRLQKELVEFEAKVDGLSLMVFDQYMKCQNKIFEIRAKEVQMRSAKLLEQVNKRYVGPVSDGPDIGGEAKDDSNI